MKKLFPVLFVILIISCSNEPECGKVWIVSVGLDYANTVFTTLNGTVADSLEVSQCLFETYEKLGIEACVINMVSRGMNPDEKKQYYPTAEHILQTIQSLNTSVQDLIVFFFSGHGLAMGGDSFVACAKDGDDSYTSLWMSRLFSALEEKNCPCVAMIDSCYSGYLAYQGDENISFLNSIQKIFTEVPFSEVSVICSGSADEKSLESSTVNDDGIAERHGLFTLKLLDSLGWVHTAEGGYLANPCRHMTVQKLYEKITGNWPSEKQFPVTNNNTVIVNLIP